LNYGSQSTKSNEPQAGAVSSPSLTQTLSEELLALESELAAQQTPQVLSGNNNLGDGNGGGDDYGGGDQQECPDGDTGVYTDCVPPPPPSCPEGDTGT
jgi:hypothetical protein